MAGHADCSLDNHPQMTYLFLSHMDIANTPGNPTSSLSRHKFNMCWCDSASLVPSFSIKRFFTRLMVHYSIGQLFTNFDRCILTYSDRTRPIQ
jgi:hypothetical protein